MVSQFRDTFQDESLPFYWVQLAPYWRGGSLEVLRNDRWCQLAVNYQSLKKFGFDTATNVNAIAIVQKRIWRRFLTFGLPRLKTCSPQFFR